MSDHFTATVWFLKLLLHPSLSVFIINLSLSPSLSWPGPHARLNILPNRPFITFFLSLVLNFPSSRISALFFLQDLCLCNFEFIRPKIYFIGKRCQCSVIALDSVRRVILSSRPSVKGYLLFVDIM